MIFYPAIILCFLAICVLKFLRKKRRADSMCKTIPTERGLPLIGVLNKVEKPLCNYLWKLSQKHGPIFQLKFGMRNIVVLNSFELIKAALVENAETLSGRWKALRYVMVTNDSGMIFIDGSDWAKQKSFAMKTLKDFGVGKSRSMEIIGDECTYLLDDLEKRRGQPLKISHVLYTYTLNVISKFMINKRYCHGDPDLEILDLFMRVAATGDDPLFNFLLMFPFLENRDWLMKVLIRISSRQELADDCHKFIERELKEHLRNLDFNGDGEDFMDKFLIKQHQLKEKNGKVESFTDFQLVRHVLELLTGGYDTTSTTLTWSFLFMAMFPKVQEKVRKEIIDQIGNEKIPEMSDKSSLTYTQAVLDEILRLSCVVPLGVFHRALTDINVKGYSIPKDTIIIPNILASHLDPSVWKKPYEFFPEHFLSTDAEGNVTYKPREQVINFSMGKRICPGESLARMELFIFFVCILRRFSISLAKEEANVDILRSNSGIIRTPLIEDFIFK